MGDVAQPGCSPCIVVVAAASVHTDIRGHCAISDLAAVIQERKSDAYMRHSRERAALDRANNASRAQQSMNEAPGRR